MIISATKPRGTSQPRPKRIGRKLPAALALMIAAAIFSSFLTELKLLASIRNNVGPFEAVGGLVILYFLVSRGQSQGPRVDPLVKIMAAMLLLAAASQLWIAPTHYRIGLIQVVILAFMVALLLAFDNIVRDFSLAPPFFLRWVTIALLMVGPWILLDGASSIQVSGPFRNRAHMASYMLTTFWLCLVFALWPRLKLHYRLLSFAGLGMSLYAVAISGRRSVYLSLMVGLTGLAVGFILANRGRRLRMALIVAGIFGFLSVIYFYGAERSQRLAFFKERVAMVDDRLAMAVGVSDDEAADESFFALQRQGVMMAFNRSPLVGIGWGGFPKSIYSPTGHEVHSTPLRFLAELGVLGFLLYVAFEIHLIWRSFRLYLRMRSSPYSASYLTLLLAMVSLSVSYVYNRHLTERTFYLLVILVFSAENFSGHWLAWIRRQRGRDREARSAAPKARRPGGSGSSSDSAPFGSSRPAAFPAAGRASPT